MQRYEISTAFGTPGIVIHDDTQQAAWPATGWAAVDQHGCSWAADFPSGWEDVDFHTPTDEVAGIDGGLIGPQSIGIRTLAVHGTIVAPDRTAARAATARLRNALPRRGQVVFTLTDADGAPLYVTGTPTGPLNATPEKECTVIYSFSLVCTDPYKRSGAVHSLSTGLPHEGASTGMVLGNLVLGDLVLATTAPLGGGLTANNQGDAEALPTITIAGPVWDPIVRNVTTGAYSQWSIYLDPGRQMVVDFTTRLILVDGQREAVPFAGYGSAPWSLPPGFSDIEFRSRDSLYDAAARLTLAWSDAYR